MMLYVYENIDVFDLEPITHTHPAFDIRCVAFTCLERIIKLMPKIKISLIVRDSIASFVKEKYPNSKLIQS